MGHLMMPYHETSPQPEGVSAQLAMRNALESACLIQAILII